VKNLERNNKRNQKEIKDTEFEILGNIEGCNIGSIDGESLNLGMRIKKLFMLSKINYRNYGKF